MLRGVVTQRTPRLHQLRIRTVTLQDSATLPSGRQSLLSGPASFPSRSTVIIATVCIATIVVSLHVVAGQCKRKRDETNCDSRGSNQADDYCLWLSGRDESPESSCLLRIVPGDLVGKTVVPRSGQETGRALVQPVPAALDRLFDQLRQFFAAHPAVRADNRRRELR